MNNDRAHMTTVLIAGRMVQSAYPPSAFGPALIGEFRELAQRILDDDNAADKAAYEAEQVQRAAAAKTAADLAAAEEKAALDVLTAANKAAAEAAAKAAQDKLEADARALAVEQLKAQKAADQKAFEAANSPAVVTQEPPAGTQFLTSAPVDPEPVK